MISNPVRILTCAAIAALMVGCKLNVIVPPGGTVTLGGGFPSECPEATVCEVDVAKATYSEEFTAIPNPGYEFVRWQGGKGFLCADSTNTLCGLSINGSDFFVNIVASRRTNYIMPVFKDVGVDTDDDGQKDFQDPDDDNDGINDTEEDLRCTLNADPVCGTGHPIIGDGLVPVRADGKEWAQLDLFLSLSWSQINEVCPPPQGICGDGAVLNGWDMTGWAWASVDDMAALFNAYLVRPALNSQNVRVTVVDSSWVPAFAADGWRPSFEEIDRTDYWGMTRIYNPAIDFVCDAFILGNTGEARDTAQSCQNSSASANRGTGAGAWFYRQ